MSPVHADRADRADQLTAAANAGDLYYDDYGQLWHHSAWPGTELAATKQDAAIVDTLVRVGSLRVTFGGVLAATS